MSLYEKADGLLATHVTFQDVQSAMQTVLGTTAMFGNDRRVSDIGEMKGFMSKIAMIQTDWTTDSIEDGPVLTHLPDRLVVKISSELSLYGLSQLVCSSQWDVDKMKSMVSVVKECHNREVGMYRILHRERPSCPIVNVFAMECFTEQNPLKAYIISEYIPNLHHVGLHQSISIGELKPVVDGIAAFSAMGEKMSEEERSGTIGEVYIEEAVKYFYGEHSPGDMRKNFVEILGVAYEEKVEEAMDIFDSICNNPDILKQYSKVSEFIGHRPVLQHSDIWPSNMLFTRSSSSGLLEFQALIDFQTASLGSPGLDVASLLVTCLSKNDRRAYKEEILDRYFDAFQRLGGAEPPYTRDQLHMSYDLCFPASVILMLPYILSFSMKAGDIIPEESIDKIIGLLEDLVTTHESNLKNIPEFFHI